VKWFSNEDELADEMMAEPTPAEQQEDQSPEGHKKNASMESSGSDILFSDEGSGGS